MAVEEGITEIIATSHALHPLFHADGGEVIRQVEQLNREITSLKLPIKIHIGHEVRLSDDIVRLLKERKLHTLAESKYLLLELPSQGIPPYTIDIIQELLLVNIIPIIAHPERNRSIAENPTRLKRLIEHGAIAQITSGSLAGHFGRAIQKLSIQLLEANLVHTYGSDVHNSQSRPYKFDQGLRQLEKHKMLDMVDVLLENNARIIENEEIILLEPQEFEKKKWWNLFS